MKSKVLSAVLFLNVLAAPHALAYQEKPAEKPTKEAIPAAAALPAATKSEFTLPVKGLSATNAAQVESTLEALSIKEYVCPGCNQAQARAGECAGCDLALVSEENPAFKEVKAVADKGSITFHLESSAGLRLSAIESALRAKSVEVQREKLQLGEHSALIYTGGASADDAAKLEKALRDAKLADAETRYDAETREIHVHLGKGAPSWQVLADVGSKLPAPLKLTDVAWGRGAVRPT